MINVRKVYTSGHDKGLTNWPYLVTLSLNTYMSYLFYHLVMILVLFQSIFFPYMEARFSTYNLKEVWSSWCSWSQYTRVTTKLTCTCYIKTVLFPFRNLNHIRLIIIFSRVLLKVDVDIQLKKILVLHHVPACVSYRSSFWLEIIQTVNE